MASNTSFLKPGYHTCNEVKRLFGSFMPPGNKMPKAVIPILSAMDSVAGVRVSTLCHHQHGMYRTSPSSRSTSYFGQYSYSGNRAISFTACSGALIRLKKAAVRRKNVLG